jgi:hypothetical protein
LAAAVIVAVELVATATVVTLNAAEVWPARMVTVAGTVAAPKLEVKVIGSPPVGAALEMVTVPTEMAPPTSVAGLSDSAVIVGALMFSAPVTLVAPTVAPMFATTLAAVPDVVTVNAVELAPAPIVTEPGTCAAALSELRLTTIPPLGA